MTGEGVAVERLSVVARGGGSETQLVEDVSLRLAPATIMGIVGETGAGKTLTMRALLGLLPRGTQASGALSLAGAPPLALEAVTAVRGLLGRQTSVVLQNPLGMFDPLMRIRDQLTEGVVRRRLMTSAQAAQRASQLVREMGFSDPDAVQRLYPHQLSGGMAQRLACAMAMMPRPQLLVLDEPTSALDANVRVEVLKLFRRLAQDEGTAVFLVSHDLGLVGHFCDAIAVMYAGRVLEHGRTAEVLAAPQHPYTVALLSSSATLTARRREPLPGIEGAPPRPGTWPSGCVFEPRCTAAFERCKEVRPALSGDPEHATACLLVEREDARAVS